MTALLVVLGGAVGAPLRFLVDRAVQRRLDSGLPWGTWIVNVVGSVALGGLVAATLRGAPDELLALLGVGLCGALTTWSTFSFETVRLVEQRRAPVAVGYVAVSLVAGLAGCAGGYGLVVAL